MNRGGKKKYRKSFAISSVVLLIFGVILVSAMATYNSSSSYNRTADTSKSIWYVHEGESIDYIGNGTDGDGIGDVPHNITTDGDKDIYPLMEPFENYHVQSELVVISTTVVITGTSGKLYVTDVSQFDVSLINATKKACEQLNISFEYDGENKSIDGLCNPLVFLYNMTNEEWTNITTNYTLKCSDIIGWSDAYTLPRMRPDLTPEDITITSFQGNVYANVTNKINVTIRNEGIANASNVSVVLKANDILIDNETIERINRTDAKNIHFGWMPERVGNYTLSVEVDQGTKIAELNETNNNITKNVTVELPPPVVHVSSIAELQDMIDFSPVIVANHGWMAIYLDDKGIYEEKLEDLGFKHIEVIKLTDKQNLSIISESKDVTISIKEADVSFAAGHGVDVINISNSSNLELRGFIVEVLKENKDVQVQNTRNICIKDSNNITLRDLSLNHQGHPGDSGNIHIKIENSKDCVISDNFISHGTVGIKLLNADNNSIYNNTIRFGEIKDETSSIYLKGYNNTIYFNNLFGPAEDYGSYNRWNSTTLSNYTYNGTTRNNYTGNHWNDYSGIDNNGDGIGDVPYEIGGDAGAFDYYPLMEPHGLSVDMIVKTIARPSIIYANRSNAILASVERTGTYPLPVQIRANLTVNGETYSKTITMNNGEHKVVRFAWNPENTGNYHLEISVGVEKVIEAVEENNIENNNLSMDVVEVSSPPYVDNYSDNITSALDFLNESQYSTGCILGFSTSAWTALAITAAGNDPTSGRWKPYNDSLIDYLKNKPEDSVMHPGTNPYMLNDIEDFARMVLVISAVGKDPTDFGGVNYLVMLKSYYNGEQFGDKYSVEDDALAILALVSCGENYMIRNATKYIKSKQNETDGGWGHKGSDVRTTSLAIQALIAAEEAKESQVNIMRALEYLKSAQDDDGGFSDVESTAYAIQAIIAAEGNLLNFTQNGTSPLDYLLSLQQKDGSFNKTQDRSFFPPRTTSFAIPALCAIPYPVMKQEIRDDYELPDVSVDSIQLKEDEICVNTSYTVTVDVKSNGGIFYVDLYSEDKLVASKEVNSVWHDSLSQVAFSWTPNHTDTYNLTAFADSGNRIEELHEENNNATVEVNVVLPDLYPSEIITPAEIYVNATNVITCTIKGVTDECFNVTLDAEDGVLIGENRIERLKKEMNISFEWRPSENGSYNLMVTADAGDEVRERDENNTLTNSVKVVRPDLVPVVITSDEIYVNATNEITVTVEGTAECFNISLIENETVVGKRTNVTCYGTKNVSIAWKPGSIGNHTLTIFVDSDNDIQETDEGNNTLTEDFEVLLPDLVPVEITPEVIYIREVNTISVKVNGTAEGFNATLMVNDTVNETLIGKKTNINTYNGSIKFKWLATEPGAYNLTVSLDSDGDVVETNETNNNLTKSVIVVKRIKLQLLSPLGAEVWSGIHNITWNATYEMPLAIDLLYSPNKGESWINITVNESNDGIYEWDTGTVNDGEYMLKVVARCGKIRSEDRSGIFIIRNGVAGSGGIGGNARYFFSDAPDEAYLVWWSEDIFAESASSVVVQDDKVFVYCTGEGGKFTGRAYTYLVALDEWTGELIWTAQLDPVVGGSWSSPAYHHGRVFAASGQYVYCIDSDDGKNEIWKYRFADGCDNINGGPCIVNGNVYVGTHAYSIPAGNDTGHVYCLSENNGTEKWNFSVQTGMFTNPTAADSRIYFGDFPRGKASPFHDGKPRIYCVDAITGKEVWNVTVAFHVGGSVVAIYGVVYAATFETDLGGGSRFYALNADNGSARWVHGIHPSDSTPACYSPKRSSTTYVYVCGGYPDALNSATYCFNASTGNETWKKPGLGGWTNSPAVSRDGKVLVGAKAAESGFAYEGLYCLDALTGDEIWNSSFGGSSPYIADGMVFTIGANGVVYAFGSKNGTADLLVDNLSVSPERPSAKNLTFINATVKNNGTARVNENFSVTLSITGSDITPFYDSTTINWLKFNKTENITFAWIPELGGKYHVVVEANPEGEGHVPESNITNNRKSVDVTVTGYPDLVIDGWINDEFGNIPSEAYVGDSVPIKVIITNNGTASTGGGFNVSLSIDGTHDNTSIPPARIPELESFLLYKQTEDASFLWNPDTPGNYTLKFMADCDNDINEGANEGNNIMAREIGVVVKEEEEDEDEDDEKEDDNPGFGTGSGGGYGGGSAGGIGAGSGTGGAGAGEAGGMQVPVNASGSAEGTKKKVSGFPFGNAFSGESGGGGTLPIFLMLLLILVIAIFFFGYYQEKRNHAKHISPKFFRVRNGKKAYKKDRNKK